MRPLILRIAARIEMKWSASCRPKPASLSSATCMMSEVLSRERGGYCAWMGDRLAFSHARSICLSRSLPILAPSSAFLEAISRTLAEPATSYNRSLRESAGHIHLASVTIHCHCDRRHRLNAHTRFQRPGVRVKVAALINTACQRTVVE